MTDSRVTPIEHHGVNSEKAIEPDDQSHVAADRPPPSIEVDRTVEDHTPSDLTLRLSDMGGEIKVLRESAIGLRRDVDRLPDKFGVAGVLVFVITGLGAAALFIKNVWPLLSKAFAP